MPRSEKQREQGRRYLSSKVIEDALADPATERFAEHMRRLPPGARPPDVWVCDDGCGWVWPVEGDPPEGTACDRCGGPLVLGP